MPDFPWGRSEEAYRPETEHVLGFYGPRAEAHEAAQVLGPADDEFLEYLRFGASPGMLEALYRMNRDIDVRHVLPAVRVPTLVLHGAEDRPVSPEVGRYVADHIPSARFVEIPGAGHLALRPTGQQITDEIRTF